MQDYEEILARFDDPVRWEFPAGYDRPVLERRFSAFLSDLESKLCRPLRSETGSFIQDASFFAEIFFDRGGLRFSNFGSMIAFTPEHEVQAEIVTAVHEIAPVHGFLEIPTPCLETSYSGRNPGVTGIDTWWTRYFDYV